MIALEPGTRVERYEVLGPLGVGGMARVFRVRHVELGSEHALKLLQVQVPGLHERLLLEGRIQATLRHPNVVAVTDVVRIGGAPALVMELVRGPSLEALIARFPPSLPQIDALAHGLFAGVIAAHEAGLIHRDLKPANVLISVDNDAVVPKITDFGLARALDRATDEAAGARRTRSGTPMGTPAFLAPEQFRDAKHADHRADLFSLGAILYELVSGTPAFPDCDLIALYEHTSTGRYRPVRDVAPQVPERIAAAIDAALRPDPADRPLSCAALRAIWFAGATAAPPDPWEPAHVARIAALTTPAPGPMSGVDPTLDAPVAGTLARRATSQPPEDAPRRSPWLAVAAVVAGAAGFAMVVAVAVGIGWLWMSRGPTEDLPVDAAAAIAPEPEPPTRSAPEPDPAPPPPPAPIPVAAPVPSPAEPEVVPTPAPAIRPASGASVSVLGAGRAVLVRAADGAQLDPGPLTPGRYDLLVWFDERRPVAALQLDLADGEHREITCTPALKVCK